MGSGSVEGASWVVDLSVLLGWAYLAGENDGVWESGRWLILLGVAGIVLILKFLPRPESDDESHQITA